MDANGAIMPSMSFWKSKQCSATRRNPRPTLLRRAGRDNEPQAIIPVWIHDSRYFRGPCGNTHRMLNCFRIPEDIAVRVSSDAMRITLQNLFIALGMTRTDAEQASDVLIYADVHGI